jgi:hypothetical protein
MIHLRVAAVPERSGCRCCNPQASTRMVKGDDEATQRRSFYRGHRHAKEKL